MEAAMARIPGDPVVQFYVTRNELVDWFHDSIPRFRVNHVLARRSRSTARGLPLGRVHL
jgi:hypothetical protein